MKGGRDAARLAHRTRYFATREGVQLLKDDNSSLPATKKQQQYIRRLLRSFPAASELPEHEDYVNMPSRQTAFDLIAQIHEDFIEPMDSRENYLDYVANRPGVKALGEHGLWDANGKVPSLENAVAEVAQHTGNVWTPVISLSRENAERLGYTNLENWQALINATITDIAKGYKINPNHIRWYAAMHEKEKHIHVHMVIFSSNPSEGYLSRQGIRNIKSALVNTIYRNDRMHIYEQKDRQRNLLQQEAESQMSALIEQMATGTLQSDKLELLIKDLSKRLQEVGGKKVYGYLPPRIKRIVDEIVDELSKDERVSTAYSLWQDLREELCKDFNQTPPMRVPLSQQKEFKTVRNMVIRETFRLSDMNLSLEDDITSDEQELEEPDSINDLNAERTVYQQTQFYNRAKNVLVDPEPDPSEKAAALVTLHRLWEEGYSAAAHQLGRAYRDGLGITADHKAAVEWFQKSAEAGNRCSAYALSKLLLEQEQILQALRWLRQAAEQNDQYAQYRLGNSCCRNRTNPCAVCMPTCYKNGASTARYSMLSRARNSSTKAVKNPRTGQRNITTPCSSDSMNTAFPVMGISVVCTPWGKAIAATSKAATRSAAFTISAAMTRSMSSRPLSTYSPTSPFSQRSGRSITMLPAAGRRPFL